MLEFVALIIAITAPCAACGVEWRRGARWSVYSATATTPYYNWNTGQRGTNRGTTIGVTCRPRFRGRKHVQVAFIEIKVNHDNNDYLEQVAVARARAAELALNLNMDGSA